MATVRNLEGMSNKFNVDRIRDDDDDDDDDDDNNNNNL
jgi:hypothetical protein